MLASIKSIFWRSVGGGFVVDIKREKVAHEAPLIQCFCDVIGTDARFGFKRVINLGNDNASCSDIEYLSNGSEYLIVEAKSHESKDAYNTRHKIFGQLLKEHGKKSQSRQEYAVSTKLGLLIPKDKPISSKSSTKKSGYDFYRDGFTDIPNDIFSSFGELVKVQYVFVCSVKDKTIDIYSWVGFRGGEQPIYVITPLA